MSMVELPYEESLPPSLLGLPGGGPSTGATAGIPGTWTPAGSTPPATQLDAIAGVPYRIVANPLTPWTSGQFVQTGQAGAAGRVAWSGTSWVGGAAPLAAGRAEDSAGADNDPSSEPPPPERRRPNGRRRS